VTIPQLTNRNQKFLGALKDYMQVRHQETNGFISGFFGWSCSKKNKLEAATLLSKVLDQATLTYSIDATCFKKLQQLSPALENGRLGQLVRLHLKQAGFATLNLFLDAAKKQMVQHPEPHVLVRQ
jgi:hypothetical protein